MVVPTFWLGVGTLSIAFQSISADSKHIRREICNTGPGYNVNSVVNQSRSLASHSWEYGTAAEALLELYNPAISVFGANPFPGNRVPVVNWAHIEALSYAQKQILTNNQTLIDGDGAVGDPASLGVSAILIGQTNKTYLDAAAREADYILNTAPRYWNDAISQRENTPELWADFMYMAPPFLAYYAVATHNTTLLNETIQQCGLYRQVLQANVSSQGNQSTFTGAWEHIIGPNDYQPGLWSTGNAWAAAGMARVLATSMKWGPSTSWTTEHMSLKKWIKEIIDSTKLSQAIAIDPNNGLLRNFLNDTTWFGETSGTSLISSVIYRMAILDPETFDVASGNGYVEYADKLRGAVAAHVAPSGIISPAVDPENWNNKVEFTTGSPEGESFGVILASAYRDWGCVGL